MRKFYKRWQFWFYLVVVILEIVEVTYASPFNISDWQSWLSVAIILLLSYSLYDEIKHTSTSKQK